MKKADLVEAAKNLNTLLFDANKKEEGWIYIDEPSPKLKQTIKEAALWLLVSDDLEDTTVEVLKQLDWSDTDFDALDFEQAPLPLFHRYGIIEKDVEAEDAEEAEEIKEEEDDPEPEVVDGEVVEDEVIDEEVPEPEEPAEKPEAREYTDSPPPKREKREGPSAYGTALALMGPDPSISVQDLYDLMRAQGFDIQKSGGSIKTAHSIFKKVHRYLGEHGHLKKK